MIIRLVTCHLQCSEDPSLSVIRGTKTRQNCDAQSSQCGDKCYNINDSTTLSAGCETKVQTALLCSTGTIPQELEDGSFTGFGDANRLPIDPFKCPQEGGNLRG